MVSLVYRLIYNDDVTGIYETVHWLARCFMVNKVNCGR
jgi:hypothetical protein